MRCSDCGNWVTLRATNYDDGEQVVTFRAPEGKGRCDMLKTDTAPDFGCTAFTAGNHARLTVKPGSPWQHHVMGPCPDCRGAGSSGSACDRCAGTGRVRHYDDGFVGDEKTRLHPKEKEIRQQVENLDAAARQRIENIAALRRMTVQNGFSVEDEATARAMADRMELGPLPVAQTEIVVGLVGGNQ